MQEPVSQHVCSTFGEFLLGGSHHTCTAHTAERLRDDIATGAAAWRGAISELGNHRLHRSLGDSALPAP